MARIDPAWDGPPRAAHLQVTYRCNLKSAHCDSWKVRQHGDLSVEQWAQALEGLDSLDVVKVLGGEPFARSDMPELLTLIRRSVRPHLLQLTTNGMLEDRLVDAIERMAWPGLQLRLSVDGLGATRQIRSLTNGASVPIVALSANVFAADCSAVASGFARSKALSALEKLRVACSRSACSHCDRPRLRCVKPSNASARACWEPPATLDATATRSARRHANS
jgi:CheY-like chemotaxis protein